MVQRLVYRSRHSYATKSNHHRIVKTPGGKLTYQTTKKRASGPKCPVTGKRIQGIPHLRPAEYKSSRLSRNRRTVNRAYGGVLSGSAVRERIIRAFLLEEQKIVKKVLKLQKANQKAKKKVAPKSLSMDSDTRTAVGMFPRDILKELLATLPLKPLMKFKSVSGFWKELITSEDFTDLHFQLSSSTERVYTDGENLFVSIMPNEPTDMLQIRLDLTTTLPPAFDVGMRRFVSTVRGLICYSPVEETQTEIVNFSTRQVLRLPQVEPKTTFEGSYRTVSWKYFGYDPINNEYKVLATLTLSSLLGEEVYETQVFVLGRGASWRMTKSLTSPPPPDVVEDSGIAINGFLYYGAKSVEKKCVLIRFDLSSEIFKVYDVPDEAVSVTRKTWPRRDDTDGKSLARFVIKRHIKVTNYQDRVAIINSSRLETENKLDLWVGEEDWSHKEFDFPCDDVKAEFNRDVIEIKGSFRSGEISLILSSRARTRKPSRVFYHLDNECMARRFQGEIPFESWQPDLWEYRENLKHLVI